ncbi:26S proteasome non-ATPase regulatory subunit 12 [Lamellibrachia satsuma]|nr:26S proteasome non-ATPase regulatory subunit 12 [Lamellibrachia satsuma]
MSGEGKLERMEVDYSSTADEKIPECAQLAKSGKLGDAIDILMGLEKQTRTGSDAISTGRLLVAIVKMCFEAKKWDLLNEQIVLLTKRRGQLKQAVTKMVQEAYGYVEKTPSMDVKLKLIATLRTVTDGKIYVEIERARLTRTLAKIKEEQGAITEAANILQELQVETFGSMDKKEKVEFILEQMRLCIAKKDFIRTQIISKKINTKFFADETTQDLKLKFYQLMIELGQHEGAYLAICKHYRAVVDTPSVREDKDKRNEALKCVVIYLILAPYDNEQCDLLQRVKETEQMDDLPLYMELLKLFTTSEIMRWKDLCTKYQQELQAVMPGNQVFNPKTEDGIKRWKDLKARVVEHNIRVMAKYYTRISMMRMANLLDLTEAETEEFLSALVVNKTIQAKIDRLAGIIHFQRTKDPNDILNDWSFNINSLMSLLNKTTHLITKEEMIHKLY